MEQYILDDKKNPVKADFRTASEWATKENRVVKQEHVGNWYVSTVFLGLDHNWGDRNAPDYKPILFETMIFWQPTDENKKNDHEWMDEYQERYHTWDEALAGHAVAVEVAKKMGDKENDETNV